MLTGSTVVTLLDRHGQVRKTRRFRVASSQGGIMAIEAMDTVAAPRLTVVPNPQAEQMAALVWLREKARQGASLPKAAWDWAVAKLEGTGFAPTAWIHRIIATARSWAYRAMGLLGKAGAGLGALWLATSEKGQQAIEYGWDKVISGVKWSVDAAVAAVATPISWLGSPGRWVANKILAAKDWVYGKLGQLWSGGAKVREQLRHDKPAVKVVNGIARFAGVAYGVLRFVAPGPFRLLLGAAALPMALRPEARSKAKEFGGNLKAKVATAADELPEHGPKVMSRDESVNFAVTRTMAWLANDESFTDETAMQTSLQAHVQPVLQQILSGTKAELVSSQYARTVVPFTSVGTLEEQRTLLTELLSEAIDQPVTPADKTKTAHPAGSARNGNKPRSRR